MVELEARIKDRFSELNKRFQSKSGAFPLKFFIRHDAGGRHIEYDTTGKISLIGTDRGKDTCRLETYDIDELMYWIFRSAAKVRAQSYQRDNSHPTGDSRRVWFPKAVEEISKISTAWADRLTNEQNEILRKHPFIDCPTEAKTK